MSHRTRLALFALGGPGFAIVLVIGLHGLPAFGNYHGIYGLLLNRIEPHLRHATDIVTALNFDIRAFDTLGEEFILFASVAGVALLLRHLRMDDEHADRSRTAQDHRFAGASSAVRMVSLWLIPLLVALGATRSFTARSPPAAASRAGSFSPPDRWPSSSLAAT